MAKNNSMSREERDRKGGEATSQNHEKDFYQKIGQKGGIATAEYFVKEFYRKIGKKGGNNNSSRKN